MVNSNTAKCKNCMVLIRKLVLDGLQNNQRITVKYISSKNNFLADSLSRMDLHLFKSAAPWMNEQPDENTSDIWPLSRNWLS